MPLREARASDLDALLELERVCYAPAQAYSRAEYWYALHRAKAVNLVLEEGGVTAATAGSEDPDASADALRIIGFIGAFHHRTQRTGHIYTVNVHPKERGRGLGRTLLSACEDRLAALGMRRVMLEVNVENEDAIRLYERCGYTRVERLVDYYTTYRVNDAWLYLKELAAGR